jgi:NAD(P)-dependent dehydrogenase (short-subunit alcohol dehydrogenase family)
MKLAHKTIIVTGSTMGIGAAIARRLHAEGAKVLIHGLEEPLAQALAESLGGERCAVHIDDLSDPQAPQRLIEAALHAFGPLDGLVNNAAIVATGNIDSTDAALFDRMLAVNTRAPLLLIKAALPHLAKTKGSVVNIGSVNAHCGEPNLLPYSIAKGALMTLTRNLGDTLHREHGVRVNQVNPGWILTEAEQARKIEQGLPEDWPAHLPSQLAPAGRLFKPEEIAEAALFYLSSACGPVSGSVLEMEQYPLIGRNPPKDL